MSDVNPDMIPDASGGVEAGVPFERPKSRLPRLPQPSTPKPPEYDPPDLMSAMKSLQKATTVSPEAKINTHALSVRQYLESTVVPILMKGLLTVVRIETHLEKVMRCDPIGEGTS